MSLYGGQVTLFQGGQSGNTSPGEAGHVQRGANRRCAGLSRSVQRPEGARLSAGLAGLLTICRQ